MFWKREGDNVKPVVDLIFNPKSATTDHWFRRDLLVQKVLGPDFGDQFNYFEDDGHDALKRHYFINRNYGGCSADYGFIVVADT